MSSSPDDRLKPLRRARQVREFTPEPVDQTALDAIVDVGRWSGSSMNTQPWRFIVVRDVSTLRRLQVIGMPQTRSLKTAVAAIAIVLPEPADDVSFAYDEGRAAERMLIAAGMLDLGAGIAWVRSDVRAAVGEIFALPANRFIRTIVALGHPTDAARHPKTAAGAARLPRAETVYEESWRKD